MLNKEMFRKTKNIKGVTAIGTTRASIDVKGSDITLFCESGAIWINPTGNAVADDTAIKLTEGTAIELNVEDKLSIISDGTGGKYQYIIWKV